MSDSRLPIGWQQKALGDICDIDPEILGGDVPADYEFQYIDIGSVATGKISEALSIERFCTAPSRARKRARRDDVLMATVRPNLKAFAKVERDGEFVASTGFAVLRARTDVSDAEFLKQLLFSESIERQVASLVAGSNYPAITVGNVRRLLVDVPPPSEQRRIAKLLSTLDEQIAQTEAEASKLNALTTGAFDDVFGAGAVDGLSMESLKVGALARGWSRVTLSQAAPRILDFRGRTPLKLGMDWGGGDIAALSANNVEMGQVNFEKESNFGSEALYRKWMTRGECHKDDVLMTLEAPLGNVALVPDDRKYILSQRVILLKPNAELMNGVYLSLYLRWRWFQAMLNEESTGTTATGIQRKKLERLPVLVAPKEQRAAIAEFLHGLLRQQSRLHIEVKKFKLKKQGLMADLLEGKKRLECLS
jgi:type I restriction enzyme S subunit